jgi:outer membrane lipoprotein carrier protein
VKSLLVAVLCLPLLVASSKSVVPAAASEQTALVSGGAGRYAARPAVGRYVAAIVHALESRYHSAATFKATFLERYTESRKDARIESGTVYFSRPGRMRWEYESPEEKLFVADGKTVWFYVPADRTVTRARMKESADWRTPLALLTGPPGRAKLSRLCGRIELADQRPAAAGDAVLRCLPRAEAARARSKEPGDALGPGEGEPPFREVLLEVNTSRNELTRVLVRQSAGVEIEYRFANWQQNPPLPEALFHFQPPPGVAIVDASSLRNSSR